MTSVAVSPNCQHIASGSGNEVWIWTKDGVIEHKLECPSEYNEVYDLAFSHDGHRILCNINRTEWTTMGHCLSQRPDTDKDPDITSIAYSPDDDRIVCGTKFGEVMIWNRETDETHKLGGHTDDVKSVAFSLDGSRIASGSFDWTVRIWEPRLQGTFAKQMDLGWLGVLSCDGRWIVATSHGDIQVWRVTETVSKTNELIIENHVESLALSQDGSRVVIGYKDGRIQVWNHLTNETECQMSGHSGFVMCVAFSYDGSNIVSGSRDNTVRIWDCLMGNEVALYQHSDIVTSVTFSHDRDSGCVAFGSSHTIWIWNPSTDEIHRKPANIVGGGYVDSVAFSYDDSHVIFGWREGVWIWNVTTNESTKLSERIQLPDGTRVHSLSKDSFHIYDPDDQETTNGIPQYLLSISPVRNWITGEQGEHICWIHPQYRAFTRAHIAKSIVYLRFDFAMVILDLKRTQHAERVVPGV